MSDLTNVRVGDVLVVRDSNERRNGGPKTVVVVKVGPKRVAYEEWGRLVYARKDDGRVSDWTSLQTVADFEAQKADANLRQAIQDLGWGPRLGHRPSLGELQRVWAALNEAQEAPSVDLSASKPSDVATRGDMP